MKTIQISDSHFTMLKAMCENYYAIPGDTPADPNKIVERMIDYEYRKYSPPEYKTTGFDRQ